MRNITKAEAWWEVEKLRSGYRDDPLICWQIIEPGWYEKHDWILKRIKRGVWELTNEGENVCKRFPRLREAQDAADLYDCGYEANAACSFESGQI